MLGRVFVYKNLSLLVKKKNFFHFTVVLCLCTMCTALDERKRWPPA